MKLFHRIRNKLQGIRVLVVGGAGYVGGAVTNELQKRGIPYAVYDILLYEDRYMKEGGHFIYGDVRDTKKLKKVLPDYTHVIWLAAIVGDPACKKEPELAQETNEEAVEWLTKNFDGRIIFTSTCSVYGASKEELTEDSPTNPLSLYARSKLAAEKHLLQHPNAIIFRLGTAFGLSDTHARPRTDLIINTFMVQALDDGKITVFGGSQKRPFISVHNIAKTIVHNIFTKNTGIYNIAFENYSINDIAEMVRKSTSCKVIYSKEEDTDKRDYHVSTKKAQQDKVLSIDKNKDIMATIKDFKKTIKRKRIKDTKYDGYSNVKSINS